MSFDVSVINKYTPFVGDNLKINQTAVDDLKLSDAIQKRLWKNNILYQLGVDNYFQSIINTLNSIQLKNCEVKYLIKGTHAWERLFSGINDVELKPQNYDLEVYILNQTKTNTPVKEVITDLVNSLISIKNDLQTTKQFNTCLYLSDNIQIGRRGGNQIIRCDSEQLSQPLTSYKQIDLGTAEELEVFKGWLLSLCFEASNFSNYNDDEYCGNTNNFSHQIFNISVFQIKKRDNSELMKNSDTKFYLQNLRSSSYANYLQSKSTNLEYFKEYFNFITTLDKTNNRTYLNPLGLLLYDSFIKRILSFRTEKGRNLEEYRLNLLKQYLLQTSSSLNNFVESYYNCNILSNIIGICPDIIVNDYFMGSLQSEIIESMLINYTLNVLPNGIKQNIDDVVIGYFRPIMNSIILELKVNLETKIPKYVKVFIAGGDGFERYISTGKIADIDIKVVILKEEGKDVTRILEAVQKIIIHILSKHSVFLNYLIKQKSGLHDQIDEDILYNNDLLTAKILCPQPPITINSKLTSDIPQGFNFKLCPQDENSSFRLRSLYKIQNMEGYHLLTLDYRKKFWVYYKDANGLTSIPLYYKYDLAILDVPIILFDQSHWQDGFIELQNGFVDNSPLNFEGKLQTAFGISNEIANTPLTTAPFFPLASKSFLIFDILERFNEESKKQLRERYLVGKIPKDISRYLTLYKDIQTGKAPDTKFNTYSKVYFSITESNNFASYLQRANFRDLRGDIIFYASNVLRKLLITKTSNKISNDFRFDGVNNKRLESLPNITNVNEILGTYTTEFLTSFTCKLDDPEEDYKLMNMVPESNIGSPATEVSMEDYDDATFVMSSLHLQNIESAKKLLSQFKGNRDDAISKMTIFVNDTSKKFNTNPQIILNIIDFSNGDEGLISNVLKLLEAVALPLEDSWPLVQEGITQSKGDLEGVYKQVSIIKDFSKESGLNLADSKKVLEISSYNVENSMKYLQMLKNLQLESGATPDLVKSLFDKSGYNYEGTKYALDLIKKVSLATGVGDINLIIQTLESVGWNYSAALQVFQKMFR